MAPDAIVNDVALFNVDVNVSDRLPGVFISAYVGTELVNVWLSREIANEVAAQSNDYQVFDWPWNY